MLRAFQVSALWISRSAWMHLGVTTGDRVLSICTYVLHAILSPLFRKSMRIAVLHQPAQQHSPKIRRILGSPEIVQHQQLQHHQIPKQVVTALCRIMLLSLLLPGPEMCSSYQIQCMEFCFSPGKRWTRSSKVGLPSSLMIIMCKLLTI